jgi:hypothetical protein
MVASLQSTRPGHVIYRQLQVGGDSSKITVTLHRHFEPIWQDPLIIEPAMCSWHLKTTMEAKEEIAQIASTLAGGDDPWPRAVRVSLVEEEQLNLGVQLIASVTERRRNRNLVWLHPYIVKEAARLIPRGTDELGWD